MKTCIGLLILTLTVTVQADNIEWHIFVPSEGVDLNGTYGDHNQAVIQGYSVNFTGLDFNDYTPFEIPDQTAVSAFSLEPISDSFVVWISFATAVDQYSPGDILRCYGNDCQAVFSVQEHLNISQPVIIDALDVSDKLISFSFDVGFTYENEFIDPKGIYSLGNNGPGSLILVEQSNGQFIGFSETGNLSSYDKSPNRNNTDFSYFFGSNVIYNYSDDADTVFSNEILRAYSNLPGQSYPLGVSEDIKSISAFYSMNTGYVGLFGENVDVSENAGSLEVELYRQYGSESYIQVMVESMDATAIESVDFLFNPSTAEWFGGDDSNKSITLDIIDNQLSDGNRTFYLYVFAASQFASIFAIHEVIEITIIDDELTDLIFADGFE